MRVVNSSSEIIRTDKLPYVLDGKIQPSFYNAGNVVAHIEGIPIPPKSSFQAGVDGAISTGSVEITFESEAIDTSQDAIKKVVCFFGKLVSENHLENKANNCN